MFALVWPVPGNGLDQVVWARAWQAVLRTRGPAMLGSGRPPGPGGTITRRCRNLEDTQI